MVHPIQFTSSDPIVRKFDLDELVIEPAHPDHGFALYSSLREVDKAELGIACSDGVEGAARLADAIEHSDTTFVISDIHGFIHGVWGHGATEENKGGINGYIWFLSDDYLLKRHGRAITRLTREYIFPAMDSLYGLYGNAMLSRNEVHKKWLTSAGFEERLEFIQRNRKMTLLLRGN